MKGLRRGQHGFTLIELLFVIIVIGILTTIAVPTYLGQRSKAKDAAVKEGVHRLVVGVESYAADNSDGCPAAASQVTIGAYVDDWPQNPYTDQPMQDSPATGDYTYQTPASDSYTLVGHLSSGDFAVP
jgi:prepilin-type N-terminal cleavage/methylation domain-containing protein